MNMLNVSQIASIILNNEYIERQGWIRTLVEKRVIDADGNPIPWYAYPAIDILRERSSLLKDLCVFEFGCGFGTFWWAARAKRVTIVEHDLEWYNKIAPQFPENVRHIRRDLSTGGAYCHTVRELLPIKFNIVIIDGRDRVNCCKNVIQSLTEDGVIIFDNTNREEYIGGREFIKNNGFKELQLYGLCPMVPDEENATSFFYKDNNCLGF